MQLPIRLLSRFARKPQRRISIERGMDKRLNTELSALRHAQPSPTAIANTLDAVRTITPSILPQPRRTMKNGILPKICCVGTVIFLGTVSAYWFYIERDPAVTQNSWEEAVRATDSVRPSSSAVPMPNAYDMYSVLVTRVDLNNIGLLPPFGKAGEWEETIRYSSDNPDRIPMEDHQRIAQVGQAILQGNDAVIESLNSSLTKPYVDNERWQPYNTNEEPVFNKLRSLLMLKTYLASDGKRYAECAEAALDVMQFATQIQTHTTLGPKVTGLRWEVPARNFLWDALPHLNVKELGRVIRRMDTIITHSQMTEMYQVLANEHIRGRMELLKLFDEPNWRWKLAQYYSVHGSPIGFWEFLKTCRYSKRQILANYDALMQEEFMWSSEPYSITLGTVKNKEQSDPASGRFMPVHGGSMYFNIVTRTQNQLLLKQTSILLYQKEKGIYPASLADLHDQEKHLTSNHQTDLFAVRDGKNPPLRYRRQNGGFVLYSVGPDMKDDGGRAIYNSDKSDRLNAVLQESQGDIVAGINRNIR